MTIDAIDSAPRLTVELVPQTCWFSNVRDRVSREDWDRMRSRVYEHAGRRCEVCGGRGSKHPVECHEVWEYDERTAVQRLVRMIALCPACHEVKHMGLAGIKGRGEIAAAHLAAVNGWTAQLTARYIEEAFALWEERSERTWSLDVSALAAYGIDPVVIAEANEVSAEDRSQTAAVSTAEVHSCEVRVIQQSEIDSYIDHLMYES
jgi:hypothetical protein